MISKYKRIIKRYKMNEIKIKWNGINMQNNRIPIWYKWMELPYKIIKNKLYLWHHLINDFFFIDTQYNNKPL